MSRTEPSVDAGDDPFGLQVPPEQSARAVADVPAATSPDAPDVSAVDLDGPARRRRFCTACGAAWEPGWLVCQPCAIREATAFAKVDAVRQEGQRDQRGVVSAIALYFALLLVSAIVIVIVLVRESDLTAGEDLAASAAFAVVTMLFALGHRESLARYLGSLGHAKWCGIGLVMALPTFVAAHVVTEVLARAFGIEVLRYSDVFLDNGWGWGWLILAVCAFPGVFEEIAFRGVILSALDRVLRPAEAIAVSAFAFAILHLSIPSMPHLLLIGVTLALLRHWSGSLYPGMIMHFTHNLLVLLYERWEVSSSWS